MTIKIGGAAADVLKISGVLIRSDATHPATYRDTIRSLDMMVDWIEKEMKKLKKTSRTIMKNAVAGSGLSG